VALKFLKITIVKNKKEKNQVIRERSDFCIKKFSVANRFSSLELPSISCKISVLVLLDRANF